MKALDKNSAYAQLTTIKEKYNVDVSRYMREVAMTNSVPASTIIFINKYIPLDQLYTYNKIHENRRKNPLYKNLVNESLPDAEKAIALSSFVTQVMIHAKELLKDNKQDDYNEYMKLMCITEIFHALNEYANGNTDILNETFYQIRRMFKNLY